VGDDLVRGLAGQIRVLDRRAGAGLEGLAVERGARGRARAERKRAERERGGERGGGDRAASGRAVGVGGSFVSTLLMGRAPLNLSWELWEWMNG
jgi:hypothetical protein